MRNQSILLVEDNPDDEALTLHALKKGKVGNDVIVARDGEEALRVLFSLETLPQVMLLDLKLPKIDGLEVLRQIRANARTRILPVVILTSSREEQDLIDGYAGGCNSYIVKPVDMKQFTDAILALELYWLIYNERGPD